MIYRGCAAASSWNPRKNLRKPPEKPTQSTQKPTQPTLFLVKKIPTIRRTPLYNISRKNKYKNRSDCFIFSQMINFLEVLVPDFIRS
jgi:hypothetical protein